MRLKIAEDEEWFIAEAVRGESKNCESRELIVSMATADECWDVGAGAAGMEETKK